MKTIVMVVAVALLAFAASGALAGPPAWEAPAGRAFLEWEHALPSPDAFDRLQLTREHLSRTTVLHIAVTRRNQEELTALLYRVSDPKHAEYGNHVSIDQLTDLIGPSQATVDSILQWLSSQGVKPTLINRNRDWIRIEPTVAQARVLLQTDLAVWRHRGSGREVIKSIVPYSVPSHLAPVIDMVSGVHYFPSEPRQLVRAPAATVPITPGILRQRYNVTMFGNATANQQSVAEFQGQYYSPSDLKTFFAKYVPYTHDETVSKVTGPNDPSDPGVEASLDIQYIMGVAAGVPTRFYVDASFSFWDDLTSWVTQLSNDANAAAVHSISYGDQAAGPSKTYKTRLDGDFQKLGARGISIIFASGDSGVGCSLCYKFEPSFPATCPHVTSVGATRFINGLGPEAAVEAFKSGGGFSWDFPGSAAPFQVSDVQHYLSTSKDLPSEFHYNDKGRGTPDVAALGIGFQVVVNGVTQSVGGTSAAAPTFAAVISLLNEVRVENGKPPLGFLNPALYQWNAAHADAFFDVTVGDNPHSCCYHGFSCSEGWDPVTGIGTPNFEVLKTLV